jgi:steroid delta-isomerase
VNTSELNQFLLNIIEDFVMNKENDAYKMSLKSREYVKNHDKKSWLGMFADNGIIEDPIGKSDLDPEGKGHSTPAQREAFWDNNIANSNIDLTIHDSYTSANECANVVTLKMTMTIEGRKYGQDVNGIFTYKVNNEGKLEALRGFWEFAEGLATFKAL